MRAILLCMLAVGCVVGGDSYPLARDLEPEWQVSGPRLLAIQAEPPTITPGQTTELRALVPDPQGQVELLAWTACTPEDPDDFGCLEALEELDLDEANPADLLDAGLIGLEPGFPPTWTAPDDLLDGLDADQRHRGRYGMVHLAALPQGALDEPEALDFEQVKSGYKRVVVSEGASNHNPGIAALHIDGAAVPKEGIELDGGQTYALELELELDAIESYTWTTREGDEEEREEEPYARWYTTDGELLQATTLHPHLHTEWEAPEARGTEGRWWVVVRDRRGGVSWVERRFTIR